MSLHGGNRGAWRGFSIALVKRLRLGTAEKGSMAPVSAISVSLRLIHFRVLEQKSQFRHDILRAASVGTWPEPLQGFTTSIGHEKLVDGYGGENDGPC